MYKRQALIDSAPATLDTLNEIAAAINDDANISTTLTNQITANTTEVRTNSASGVVISGIANTNSTNITANTNLVHASGDFLLNETRANAASGVVISGIAAAATYTAGNGLLLTGSEFTLDDPANGTSIDEGTITSSDLMLILDDDASSCKYVSIDYLLDEIDTGGGAGSFDNWKFTDGTVADDTINSAETVIISGVSGVVTQYIASSNTLRISPPGLSGVLQPQITANLNAVNASGDFLRASGIAVSGWAAYHTSANSTRL